MSELPQGAGSIPVPSLALVILDGWGLAAPGPGNAIDRAETPVFDSLWAGYPHTSLSASGRDVGLPDGQMGNSEVGHLNLGAGAIVKQDLARIDDAVADGSFFENEVLLAACDRARRSPRGRLHLLGLVSDGGVHSGWEHIEATIELASQEGVPDVVFHAFTDGRDTLPHGGRGYLSELERWLRQAGRIGTVGGRYYAMDRDTRWERTKLAYVPEIRQYAIDAIGLTPGDSYSVFDPNGSMPAAFVLAASEPDRLSPYVWVFPFLGISPAKGFFDEAMGLAEAQQLRDAGYDVIYVQADGFSTLGLFPDPVRQSNLQLELADLAELLMHEMTHSTVFKPNDADFNESMATFVGRAAADSWFVSRFGEDSEVTQLARLRWADKAVFDAYVIDLYDRAKTFYDDAAAQGLSREEILTQRVGLFESLADLFNDTYRPQLNIPEAWVFAEEQHIDNAVILTGVRYQSGLDVYQAVFDIVGGDFRAFLDVMQEAANAPNSREYLQNWLAERT